MESEQQPDRETCRVIVLNRDRTEVLLVADEVGTLLLPTVEIPLWERVAENLSGAVRSRWGCDALSLYRPEIATSGTRLRFEVMECWCGDKGHPGNALWRCTRALTRHAFRDSADYHALEHCLRELDSGADPSTSPFRRHGWFAELRSWIADVIRPRGLRLTGPFRQLNGSPSFSLIRFETNGSPVWFKAVGKPNQREFLITLELAHLFPECVPDILGTRPDWNGWLSAQSSGRELGATQEIGLWESAADALARFQLASIGKLDSILEAGARDLTVKTLSSLVDPFLGLVAQLMERQTKTPPPILSRQQLATLGTRIQDSLIFLNELGIPNALGHLDLNPGNILVSTDRCVFLDWTEAYVGHPFLTFEYVLEHFRRVSGGNRTLESRLVRSYITPWKQLIPSSVIDEAMALAPLLAVFAYAAGSETWRDQHTLPNPKAASYLRSLARRMMQEATDFFARRSPCLSP